MPDPFTALHSPVTPVSPDPAFTAALRARIDRRLRSGGTTMPLAQVDLDPSAATAAPVIVPYLIVRDARRAVEWYAQALDARLRGVPMTMPDGRIGHVELELEGGGVVYLADESPSSRVAAPRPGEPAAVSLTAQVADVDATTRRALAAGAELERPPADNPYGRNAVIRDPFGHRWILSAAEEAAGAAGGPGEGDPVYVSLWVRDLARARTFFGSVLGWSFAAQGSGSLMVEGASPSHGLSQQPGTPTLFLCYAVRDMSAATARVLAAGGTVERVADEPYGVVADCVDDQGADFALHQSAAAAAGVLSRGRSDRDVAGDLAYCTLLVPDSRRARAFYGTVLGWRFTPGRSQDGWNVDQVVPMLGVSGGHAAGGAVPVYRVADVAAAVQRVRSAGGTATDPAVQPYGRLADCSDDQGTRFSLLG